MATNVYVILDESGSMGMLLNQTHEAYDAFVKGLQDDQDNDYRMSLVTFNSLATQTRFKDYPVKQVSNLVRTGYKPNGGTPLLDAVGDGINAMKGKRKVLFVVLTDGLENASIKYTYEQIREMIAERTKAGWAFVYLAQNDAAWANQAAMGFDLSNSFNNEGNDDMLPMMMGAMAAASSYASTGSNVNLMAESEEKPNE